MSSQNVDFPSSDTCVSMEIWRLKLNETAVYMKQHIFLQLTTLTMQGGEDGGGSDIGALLGNLGPLIGSLSGVSSHIGL